MPLNLYATVNGFTTQTGSGDPSPENIRPIENAGMYNAVVIVDLNKYSYSITTSGFLNVVRVDVQKALSNMLFVEGSTVVFARSTWLPASKTITDNGDYPHFRTGSTAESANGLVLYIPRSVLAGTTSTDIKNYLAQNPLSVIYQSTDDTGKFYTGIEVEQGEDYRCEIVELQALLHDGDTLETNVQSEYDLEYTFDGTEAWSKASTTYEHCWRLYIQLYLFEKGVQASNDYPSRTLNQIYTNRGCYVNGDTIFFNEPSANTAEEFKAILAQKYTAGTPVKLFAKSQAGGTPLNIKREEHVKKQYVFTGTENIQKSGLSNNSFYVNFDDIAQNGNVGSVIYNQAKALAETDIAASRIWGVSGSTININTFCISSPETTVDAVKAKFAEQYSAGTPFIIEYELARPEVFADEPIDIPVTTLEVSVSGEGKSKVTYRIEPKYDKIKTDWKVQPPTSEGYYNGDWFELEDYVRIYNNLQTVKDLVKSIYGDFTFPTMVTPVEGSPVFASQINILEEAIRAIRNKSIAIPEIPDPKTWTDNANLFTYEDINRWESVAIYYTTILMGVYELQPKLQFKLGGAQF